MPAKNTRVGFVKYAVILSGMGSEPRLRIIHPCLVPIRKAWLPGNFKTSSACRLRQFPTTDSSFLAMLRQVEGRPGGECV